MTYTFKLARRLAVSRDFAMLAVLAIVAACTIDSTTAPDSAESIPSQAAVLSVLPHKVTAETNQSVRFRGRSRHLHGDAFTTALAWASTGGHISADGTFSSKTPGTFRVIGRGRGWRQTDTAVVVVVSPANHVLRIVVSPEATTLNPGASHTFSATAHLGHGSTAAIGVNWTAAGGDIDAAGVYTAGVSAGTYPVIAANTDGTLADTSTVTIAAPAPTLANVYVTPASVSLRAGVNQQFKAYARNSAGDSVPVTVTFSATGGTVTSGGLYTAGATAGTFRLVAREPITGEADTSSVTVVATLATPAPPPPPPPPPSTIATGIPFGSFALWNSYTTVKWGPAPLTLSQGYTDANGIVRQIAAARAMKQKLVLSMTGGSHANYLTAGQFDLAKWKARMDLFNTATIKAAVAGGVADGTIVGNSLMDEPEHPSWGGVMTKPLLDQMAAYVKAIFPTLPVGPSHGPDGYYLWHPTERYHVVDYVLNQYAWRVTKGDVAAWRDKVLAQGKLDGVGIGFSMNILGGGVQDRDGAWDCTGAGQAGKGPYSPTCRMTADQVRDWGRTLGPAGCMLLMWTYDGAFMANADNVQAMKDVAAQLAAAPGKPCRRP